MRVLFSNPRGKMCADDVVLSVRTDNKLKEKMRELEYTGG